jgi:hypothetical protein
MGTINFFARKTNSQSGKSRAHLHYARTAPRLSLMALICICFLCFMPYSSQTNTNQFKQSKQSAKFFINPEDMVQGGYYYFSDHGSGLSVAQYDRTEGSNVYTYSSMKPLLLSFSGPGLWGTIDDAGSIRLATVAEITHLLLCVLAGVFVP